MGLPLCLMGQESKSVSLEIGIWTLQLLFLQMECHCWQAAAAEEERKCSIQLGQPIHLDAFREMAAGWAKGPANNWVNNVQPRNCQKEIHRFWRLLPAQELARNTSRWWWWWLMVFFHWSKRLATNRKTDFVWCIEPSFLTPMIRFARASGQSKENTPFAQFFRVEPQTVGWGLNARWAEDQEGRVEDWPTSWNRTGE